MPEAHAGRLFDHFHLRVADIEASKRFYAGALAPLGLGITGHGDGWFSADELFVSHDGPVTAGLHFALQAPDRENGTNVEAVYHGPVERSAASVVFSWDE